MSWFQLCRCSPSSRIVSHVIETRACRIWTSLPLRLHVHKTRGYQPRINSSHRIHQPSPRSPGWLAIFTPPLLRPTFILSWYSGILANKSWTPLLTIAPQIGFENHRAICSTQRLCSPRPGPCPASGLQPILSASWPRPRSWPRISRAAWRQ